VFKKPVHVALRVMI